MEAVRGSTDPDAPVEIPAVIDLSADDPEVLDVETYLVEFLITREVRVKQQEQQQHDEGPFTEEGVRVKDEPVQQLCEVGEARASAVGGGDIPGPSEEGMNMGCIRTKGRLQK